MKSSTGATNTGNYMRYYPEGKRKRQRLRNDLTLEERRVRWTSIVGKYFTLVVIPDQTDYRITYDGRPDPEIDRRTALVPGPAGDRQRRGNGCLPHLRRAQGPQHARPLQRPGSAGRRPAPPGGDRQHGGDHRLAGQHRALPAGRVLSGDPQLRRCDHPAHRLHQGGVLLPAHAQELGVDQADGAASAADPGVAREVQGQARAPEPGDHGPVSPREGESGRRLPAHAAADADFLRAVHGC